MKIIIPSSVLLFIKLTFFPDLNLLFWMFIAMALDFICGVVKAAMTKEKITSAGYRKTVSKIIQYAGAVCIVVLLGNSAKQNNLVQVASLLNYVGDGVTILIICIEVVSILENLYAIDQTSMFSKYFIQPLLKVVTFQIKNNSLEKIASKDEK